MIVLIGAAWAGAAGLVLAFLTGARQKRRRERAARDVELRRRRNSGDLL